MVRQCLEIHCDQSITIVLLKFQWLRHGQRSLQSTINSFINTLHVQKWFHHWIAITWKSSHATNWKNPKYKIIDFCCHQIFDFFRSAQGIPCAERKKHKFKFSGIFILQEQTLISFNWVIDWILTIGSVMHCYKLLRGYIIASRWCVVDSLRGGVFRSEVTIA